MRLRRPCEHGRYERHNDGHPGSCPGGEFLAEDTLTIGSLKTIIGETFIEAMGWGESKPMAALQVYAVAELQAKAILDALSVREGEE